MPTEISWKVIPRLQKIIGNGGIQIETQPNTDGYTEYMRSYQPFEMPYINIMSAKDAYDYVLKHVGANIPCRDIVDERVVEEVRTGIPLLRKETSERCIR